ncbi:oligopeptide ABC transporter ATP-binding protein [Williamsoniiplasma somnilux]|uniref:Oligopeptide ABC transporter ATP-binding protein n=1 Tax=Williamsoniiplasma somnilux TaxID=215578 RepID=A0A2K8NYJ4_9MOLU|nr:oligopeptide ABC transporter ATP-binding protein OppD [Williamsoniiplasma somnilux]ATZ18889.1 oligopeptide ABC transporter ATP-binding protein [Williamsoniiplasma somnilux]
MENRNKILSIKDLVVKFRVRSRVLSSIRNVSFDIYDGETIAIVGESGSGKSVLTKTMTNMLESNGYIANGTITYYPNETSKNDENSFFKEETDLVKFHRNALANDSVKSIEKYNLEKIKNAKTEIKKINTTSIENLKIKISKLQSKADAIKAKYEFSNNSKMVKYDLLNAEIQKLNKYIQLNSSKVLKENEISDLNSLIETAQQEIVNFKRISVIKKFKLNKIVKFLENYAKTGVFDRLEFDKHFAYIKSLEYLNDVENSIKKIFKEIKTKKKIYAEEIEALSELWKFNKKATIAIKIKARSNLKKLRGGTIATIFQDPMTSLNPLLSVGYQICEVLRTHQNMNHAQAKIEAINLMKKVGINDAEKRFKDIPGKYSGGMRQRIVIAVALACKPKILICDEPTTALDVTIQAQILDLIKELKEEYRLTVIFITHDLGVVANIADRVAVVYAGQIIEYGTTEEIFFNSQHPYTWALLSSLPQLGEKGDELFSISGTPPSLFNEIKGDAFAPRNKFALEIDYKYEPPFFEVSQTHKAKTWLLDPRSPKVVKPKQLSRLKAAVSAAKVGD